MESRPGCSPRRWQTGSIAQTLAQSQHEAQIHTFSGPNTASSPVHSGPAVLFAPQVPAQYKNMPFCHAVITAIKQQTVELVIEPAKA